MNHQDKDGKKSEHVVANDREEDYTVPNKLRVIYDFEKVFLYRLIQVHVLLLWQGSHRVLKYSVGRI